MKITTSFLLLLTSIICYSQVLVTDLNTGEEDGINRSNPSEAYINGGFLIEGRTAETGRELFFIIDDEVNLVKDINPGGEDGRALYLTPFQDEIYFVAEGIDGPKIWKTDGTEEGTVIAFESIEIDVPFTSRLGPFVVSPSDVLYFNVDGVLYAYDGITLEQVQASHNVGISTSDAWEGINIAPYGENMALISAFQDSFHLWSIDGYEATYLQGVPGRLSFSDRYGIHQFDGGITFSLENSFDAETQGTYTYSEASGEITKVLESFTARTASINEDAVLIYSGGDLYILDGSSPTPRLVSTSTPILAQGSIWSKTNIGGKLIVNNDDPIQGADFTILDGSETSITTDFSATQPQISPMIVKGKYAFVAAGISNGFDAQLIVYDSETENAEIVYDSMEDSNNTQSFLPICVLDDILYYSSAKNDIVGRELYSYQLDFNTGTSDLDPSLDWSLSSFGNRSYQINSEDQTTIKVTQYDLQGRKIMIVNSQLNVPFEINASTGIYILQIEDEAGKIGTFKVGNF